MLSSRTVSCVLSGEPLPHATALSQPSGGDSRLPLGWQRVPRLWWPSPAPAPGTHLHSGCRMATVTVMWAARGGGQTTLLLASPHCLPPCAVPGHVQTMPEGSSCALPPAHLGSVVSSQTCLVETQAA